MRTASAVAAAPPRVGANDRAFYTGIAIAAALVVLVGFSRTYFLRPYFETASLDTAFHVHGLVFSAWIALFVAQTSLVATRRIDVHRSLGWAGACLAALMIVVALNAAVHGAHRDIAAGYETESLRFFTTPVLSMAMFASLVALAVLARGRPETHKRLMLLATISLLDAAAARMADPGHQAMRRSGTTRHGRVHRGRDAVRLCVAPLGLAGLCLGRARDRRGAMGARRARRDRRLAVARGEDPGVSGARGPRRDEHDGGVGR